MAVLKPEHIAAVRRLPKQAPPYTGPVRAVAVCERAEHRTGDGSGWHECALRDLHYSYGGTAVGIRWQGHRVQAVLMK
ncbi:hypothetical protein [Streptomyces sp. NPDC008265]|uniref:hypothetical protein n=1 Tax=Streptomyces sp. NPDC008265 TaxID=3364824 RepID=UPI0036E44021